MGNVRLGRSWNVLPWGTLIRQVCTSRKESARGGSHEAQGSERAPEPRLIGKPNHDLDFNEIILNIHNRKASKDWVILILRLMVNSNRHTY